MIARNFAVLVAASLNVLWGLAGPDTGWGDERPNDAQVISDAPAPASTPAPPHRVHKRRRPDTPQGPPPPAAVVEPPAPAVIDAEVGEVGTSLTSILGKNVQGPNGGDIGRVVDVLADAHGRVRVAVIDFGGFLGVGTRRIAVDWPLLRFDPNAGDKSLMLSVNREKLQSAPEYKDSNSPRVLMPPKIAAPADAADTGQTKK